jgi:hypothetical protein
MLKESAGIKDGPEFNSAQRSHSKDSPMSKTLDVFRILEYFLTIQQKYVFPKSLLIIQNAKKYLCKTI